MDIGQIFRNAIQDAFNENLEKRLGPVGTSLEDLADKHTWIPDRSFYRKLILSRPSAVAYRLDLNKEYIDDDLNNIVRAIRKRFGYYPVTAHNEHGFLWKVFSVLTKTFTLGNYNPSSMGVTKVSVNADYFGMKIGSGKPSRLMLIRDTAHLPPEFPEAIRILDKHIKTIQNTSTKNLKALDLKPEPKGHTPLYTDVKEYERALEEVNKILNKP